jgi:hypothetical protein
MTKQYLEQIAEGTVKDIYYELPLCDVPAHDSCDEYFCGECDPALAKNFGIMKDRILAALQRVAGNAEQGGYERGLKDKA